MASMYNAYIVTVGANNITRIQFLLKNSAPKDLTTEFFVKDLAPESLRGLPPYWAALVINGILQAIPSSNMGGLHDLLRFLEQEHNHDHHTALLSKIMLLRGEIDTLAGVQQSLSRMERANPDFVSTYYPHWSIVVEPRRLLAEQHINATALLANPGNIEHGYWFDWQSGKRFVLWRADGALYIGVQWGDGSDLDVFYTFLQDVGVFALPGGLA